MRQKKLHFSEIKFFITIGQLFRLYIKKHLFGSQCIYLLGTT